ncbi:hypothetical protein ACHAXT_008804 [Thalassiosira profunda]
MRPLPLLVAAAAASARAAANNIPGHHSLPRDCATARRRSEASIVESHTPCNPLQPTSTLHPAPSSRLESAASSLQEQIIKGATRKLLERGSSDPVPPTQQPAKPRARATATQLDESFSYYVREAQRSEINEIADVLMESFHSDSQPAFDSYVRRYKYNHLQMCFDASDESDRGLFVACAVPDSSASDEGEQIVGFCSVDGRAPDPSCKLEFLTPSTLAGTSPRPYLSDLGVSPSHRRQGIGEKLVRACEEWTHRRGHKTLYLKVEKKNAGGYGLYSALGYKKTKLPWSSDIAEAARNSAVLMEKSVPTAHNGEKRKRTWIKNQLWHLIKKSVDRYAARRAIGEPPPL